MGFESGFRFQKCSSKCGAMGDEPVRSQTDGLHSESPAKHMPRSNVSIAREQNLQRGADSSQEEHAIDVRQSGRPTVDASVHNATVQVLDSLQKGRGEQPVEEAILDITYEVLDDGGTRPAHQVQH